MDYKLNLATLKITINSAKPDSDKETIKKLENIINNQKERLRLIINNTNKTECVLNSLLYSSHPDKIKEIKIFNSCPAYRSLLLILFKLNLDLLSIESMSPMPFVFLMYSLSREKSKIFKNEEFMEVFGHYGDFIKWIDQEVQQKIITNTNQYELSLKNLPVGIYILNISDDKGNGSMKIIKE